MAQYDLLKQAKVKLQKKYAEAEQRFADMEREKETIAGINEVEARVRKRKSGWGWRTDFK